ncbi:polyamine aminopropyltransferase [Undibacterium cyanobacteriorum]|uniref:Polyamine aminopropyltransferase n=1 Tax=Undibacterium cyanobacteriorum TaxID=3073561 RepID=A0ABY9RLI0_9BURK|nr:polyamine aminopropyltransferase [Undibacterium sp. 20NA77.5]WMW82073.1 polyamine aminopropyltransferase [Undibacterium sp. 20NA77.5]
MEGLHLTADCFECQCPIELLLAPTPLEDLLRQRTIEAGLTIVGERFFPFSHEDGSAAGVTGTLLLAESHLAIHTWPEKRAITLDIYVCNFNNDNSDKARRILASLLRTFAPKDVRQQELRRGVPDHVAQASPNFIEERLTSSTSFRTAADQLICERQSAFQHIEILQTKEFGKAMRIDGAMMTTERDEHFYHETLVHPAAISLPHLRDALIIGGGDGGSSEEILKYKALENLVLCEIDPVVVELAKQHLTSVHGKAFNDPRLTIKHKDGFNFIRHCDQQFDLILLDLTDPVAPNGSSWAESCMSAPFFQDCHRALKTEGALVLHLGSEFYHPTRFTTTLANLESSFDRVRTYVSYIPSYGALWSFAVALKGSERLDQIDPFLKKETEISEIIERQGLQGLQYYQAARHYAMFRF